MLKVTWKRLQLDQKELHAYIMPSDQSLQQPCKVGAYYYPPLATYGTHGRDFSIASTALVPHQPLRLQPIQAWGNGLTAPERLY